MVTDEEYQSLKESLDLARIAKKENAETFDKNVLYITAGTLALSVTFIEKIAPLGNAGWLIFLFLAWGSLILSLLLSVLNHFIAHTHVDSYIKIYRQHKQVPQDNVDTNNRRISLLNLGTFLLMTLGIAFLIIYCSINAYKMNTPAPQPGPDRDKGRHFDQPLAPRQPAQAPAITPPPPDTTRKP